VNSHKCKVEEENGKKEKVISSDAIRNKKKNRKTSKIRSEFV